MENIDYEQIFNNTYKFNWDSFDQERWKLNNTRDKIECYTSILSDFTNKIKSLTEGQKKFYERFKYYYVIEGDSIINACLSAFHDVLFNHKDLIKDLLERYETPDWVSPQQRIAFIQEIAGIKALYEIYELTQKDYDSLTNSSSPLGFIEENLEEIKLVTIPDHIQLKLFELLKKYFSVADHEDLKNILSGSIINKKIVFKGNGNKLCDVFWFLIKEKKITLSDKYETLIKWICENFSYKSNGKNQHFVASSIINNISRSERLCKRPLNGLDSLFI